MRGSYLLLRGETFHLRMRVPASLVPAIGCSELKLSLYENRKRDAQLKASFLAFHEQAWLRLFIDLGISSLRSDALDAQNDNIAKAARVNSPQAELARRRLVERDYLYEDGWKVEVSSHLFRLLSANPHWVGSKAPVRLHAPG